MHLHPKRGASGQQNGKEDESKKSRKVAMPFHEGWDMGLDAR